MQEEFFDWGETIPQENRGDSKSGCDLCPLSSKCKNPKMEFKGSGKKKVLILFENPTRKEDKTNKIFSDEAGQDLRYYLEEMGLDLEKDCWYGYAVSCHSSKKISDNTIGHCQTHLYSQINRFNPRAIIPMGTIAIKALLKFRVGGRLSGIEYKQYIGHSIPDQSWKININPTYSFDDIYKTENFRGEFDKVNILYLKRHLKKAFQVADSAFYTHNYSSDVYIEFDKEKVISILKEVLATWNDVTFDYETTGLKPWMKGHKIYTIGISNGIIAHSFPYFHDSPRFKTLWRKILESKRIEKAAHNSKFEKIWSAVRAGATVNNFSWCTMICEHIQHNKSVVNAKFLFYVYLGVMNMDSEVDKFLKPTEENKEKYGNNAINQIDVIWKNNPRAVLQYQGEDALFTAKLKQIQKSNFIRRKSMKKAFEYYHEGILALGDVELNGIPFDEEKCDENLNFLNLKIEKLWDRTLALPDSKEWEKNLQGKTFQSHLYDRIKYPVPKLSAELKAGNRPDSKEALEEIGSEFTKKVIALRQQTKIQKTIEGYRRESVDGIIRPSYGGHNVDTFRTSANNPNIQNPFKRNKFAKKMLRQTIIPSPGRMLVAKDYKAIEVSIAGCLFPDANWLAYCNDPKSDMHADSGAEILKISFQRFSQLMFKKDIRQETKNKWVFPNIYGSGYNKMSDNLYATFSEIEEAMDVLSESGLADLGPFKKWIKEYYEYYWNEKYPDYKLLRDKAHRKYEKSGYVDSPVGYRYYGPMSYNDFCNYPVQGSAAAIKVWTIKEANKEILKRKMDSRIILEVHDDITGDVVPDEKEEYDNVLEEIGTRRVREYWDWIITPLRLETEVSSIDGDWSEMTEEE